MHTLQASGPQSGELIADFSGNTADGRAIVRREYKGRRHLVLCFVAPLPAAGQLMLAESLAARHAAFREAGAEVVVFGGAALRTAPYPSLADADGRLHARYGVAATPILIVADRYGEVVVRRALDDLAADLDEALATVEWLQMRCSL